MTRPATHRPNMRSNPNAARTLDGTPDRDDDWMTDALCATYPPDLIDNMWFDMTLAGQGRKEAQRICDRCPVTRQCLTRARDLSNVYGITLSGVWGGRYLGGDSANATRQRARRALREVE